MRSRRSSTYAVYPAAMRLRTDIFVAALMRRVFARGDFAAVEKKGAEEAGAVFVRQVFRDGTESLFAPAPQSVFDADDSGRRCSSSACRWRWDSECSAR